MLWIIGPLSRAACLAAVFLAQGAPARGDASAERLLAHEALPTARIGLDLTASTYAQRAEATAAAGALAPRIAAAVGVEADDVAIAVRPAGLEPRAAASLQIRASASRAQVERLGAALGLVTGAPRVLVARLDAPGGDVGYVGLGLPVDTLTPALAQAFFRHAAALGVDAAPAGGFVGLGDMMAFLNLRDADGAPLSGLDDMAFAARLGQAAGSFPLAQVKIARAGRAEALLIENDWTADPEGGGYARLLGEAAPRAELDALRAEHDALVAGYAARFGWPCKGC